MKIYKHHMLNGFPSKRKRVKTHNHRIIIVDRNGAKWELFDGITGGIEVRLISNTKYPMSINPRAANSIEVFSIRRIAPDDNKPLTKKEKE